ncbi:MAG: SIMPL domain-containing protein [Bacteroidaceae bacterium]|nr:SIMPL domain-containing protein [Bacteroidaceae bacterium]
MEHRNYLNGAFIMLGLCFLGIQIPKAVAQYKSFERIVTVKGLCEKEVNADKVIWPLAIKVSGNSIEEVSAEIESKTQLVREFLTKGGIPAAEITTSAASVSDRDTESYNLERRYRFIAQCVTTVCSNDVDKVRALIARQNELMQYGITFEDSWDNQTIFSFESLNDLKPEMIEEATHNAREVAQKFANDSGSRLGKIKEASQGTFSINDRDSNTPWIKNVRVVTSVVYYLKN